MRSVSRRASSVNLTSRVFLAINRLLVLFFFFLELFFVSITSTAKVKESPNLFNFSDGYITPPRQIRIIVVFVTKVKRYYA